MNYSDASSYFERFSDLLRAHGFEALQFGVAKVDAAVGGVGGCPFAGPGAWKWNTFEKTVGKHHIPGVCLQIE